MTETFQISAEQAEMYESRFVPAIFADWAPHLVDAAGVAAGATVLDVACRTGIVARTAAERATAGNVVGLCWRSLAGCAPTSSGARGTRQRCPSPTARSTSSCASRR